MSTGNDRNRAELLAANAQALASEMAWFESVLSARLRAVFPKKAPVAKPKEVKKKNFLARLFSKASAEEAEADAIPKFLVEVPQNQGKEPVLEAPDWSDDPSYYAQFVRENELLPEDRLVIMLALAPHIQPELLNRLFIKDAKTGIGDPRFGGVQGSQHGGFLPTIETAMFLLSGNNLDQRLQDAYLFHPDSVLLKQNILVLQQPAPGEPFEASQIRLSEDALAQLTKGEVWQPRFNMDFPAKLLHTPLAWKDLVLNAETMRQVEFIVQWLNNRVALKDQLGELHALKPGFKALFYGPSGTGKTLTAALLGRRHGLEVYRVDLSMVVSKYIGETEKNLEKVFARAEGKDWILFFDEADALFGKRTNISDAHDKYANQEIAYLLQRLEDYPGLVILASNMQQNIDDAFARRLEIIVKFARPTVAERQKLWEKALQLAGLSESCGAFAPDLAKHYDLTGANIVNAVHYTALWGFSEKEAENGAGEKQADARVVATMKHLYQGIRKEYLKERKSF